MSKTEANVNAIVSVTLIFLIVGIWLFADHFI